MNTRLRAALAGAFLSASLPAMALAPSSQTGIVVFTGAPDRVETGLRLYMQGKADRLLITGIDENRTAAQLLHDYKITPTRSLASIDFDRALDTLENARNANVWIRKHGFARVLLVTSGFHINRSMLMLESQNPPVYTAFTACSVGDRISDDARAAENLKFIAAKYMPNTLIPDDRSARAEGSHWLMQFSKWSHLSEWLPRWVVKGYPSAPC